MARYPRSKKNLSVSSCILHKLLEAYLHPTEHNRSIGCFQERSIFHREDEPHHHKWRPVQLPARNPANPSTLRTSEFLLVAASQVATAADTHRFSCTLVRLYVAKYTLPAAETWARSHGATDVEIETARHCLGSSVQSARFVATSR